MNPMSFPASATELPSPQAELAELIGASSIEMSPREMHLAGEIAALLPGNTCVYVPSLPGVPLSRTLEAIAAIRKAGLDPVPHVSARRILHRDYFRIFLKSATTEHGVHRLMLIGGDESQPQGPYADSLQILEEGVLADCGVREIGVAGYPEGHPGIASSVLTHSLE